MIELRGLHLGNIARSPAESVRPDLWPGHGWVPALGRTGNGVHDIASADAHMVAQETAWSATGVAFPSGSTTASAGVRDSGTVMAVITMSSSSSYQYIFDSSSPRTFLTLRAQNTWGVFIGDTAVWWGTSAPWPGIGQVAVVMLQWSSAAKTIALHLDGVEILRDVGKSFSVGTPNTIGLASRYSFNDQRFTGTYHAFTVTHRVLNQPQILDLTADPLLPFRRRVPVYYSVPSGGGTARSLIAAMTGESATGTISAIIARAISGDVTATSITGAITASMARDLLTSIQGQSATGDAAATMQRLLLASLGCASLTGDVAATMSGLVSLIAAIGGQSATGTAAATQARALLANLQAESATPNIAATLASLVALTASISGTTTTPAVAATMARALAANLAGQSTTGAVAVEFAGMLLLVASIAGTSTTGALTATTGRELRAAIATASATGHVDGQLLRQIAATIAGTSLTGSIAAELVNLVSLAASVVGVSLTPAVLATISRDLAAEVAAGSTTGEASATVARTLAAAVEAGSLTPDNLVLILTGLGILHDTTIISRTPRRGISSRTVRRTLHSA